MLPDEIFHPRSVAVVGASAGPFSMHTLMFLDTLVQFGFEGQVYPVNPTCQEVSGLKAYANLRDVPGEVDLVTSLVPAPVTPQILRDCVAKRVKSIQLFTAGFAETGEEEGRRLQDELASIARGGGVRLFGPNCVGIYCPESRVSYCADFPRESGRVSFISQSGSYTYLAVRMSAARGLRFSKVVSYGNAADVSEIDLLEYLANDVQTDVIGAYVEGTRDGQGFLRALAEAAARKPVILIKKGRTEAGSRGVNSHTGAMAGDDEVWEAALKQAGALRVWDVEEMVDLLVTFRFFPVPRGKKAVVVGVGGGVSVRASDDCEAGGLSLPPLDRDAKDELARFAPVAGSMLTNPVDILAERYSEEAVWGPVVKALDAWPGADVLLWQVSPDVEPIREEFFRQAILETRGRMLEVFCSLGKPKALAVHAVESGVGLESLDAMRTMCREHGLAFYPSLYRAARAISRYVDYHEKRDQRAVS